MIYAFILTALGIAAPVPRIACLPNVTKAIQHLGVPHEWRHWNGGMGTRFDSGATLEVNPRENETRLLLRDNGQLTSFRLALPTCRPELLVTQAADDRLLNIDYADFIKQKGDLVVYVWSPHMVLASKDLQRFKQKSAWPLLVVADPRASSSELRNFLTVERLPASFGRRADAPSLHAHNPSGHYPFTVLVRDGKVVRSIPGVHGAAFEAVVRRGFQ
jgi:hypothetical protein